MMLKIDLILERCNDIIEKIDNIMKIDVDPIDIIIKLSPMISSIHNIYILCYQDKIPEHLRIDRLENTLRNLGISSKDITDLGRSVFIVQFFKGFVEDLKQGLILRNLSKIISLNLFNDLITQAQNFREQNTEPLNRAACVLGRIVLEDTLKQICELHQITLNSDKATSANDALKKENVIPQEQWRLNQHWLDIGNKAAHPPTEDMNFNTIGEKQMDDMLIRIKEFSEKYL